MITVAEYWRYIEQINMNPHNALQMAQMSYHHGVLSLPNYLKVRQKLESQINQKK